VLDKWVPYRSESATVQLRVIGLPHAAGNALFYRSWRKHMPHDIDFCPVELPGHGQRMDEMPLTNWERLAAALQVVLEPLLTVPFAFFGHSTGACIAFEAARVLRAADGRAAMHLFVSGRPTPGLVVGDHPVHSLSDQDLVAALIRYGGTPAVVMDRGELMAAILPALRVIGPAKNSDGAWQAGTRSRPNTEGCGGEVAPALQRGVVDRSRPCARRPNVSWRPLLSWRGEPRAR
jgi:medium-chain acyl-[acyl-carrier-protein] hydrolase